MKNTVEFLDAVRVKHGLTSDYQLSKHLNCTRGAISSYRTGRTYLDEEMACKVAADLELESSYVLACIASERAKQPEVKAAWKHAADVLYGLAAVLTVVAVLPYIALPDTDTGFIQAGSGLYIMSNLDWSGWFVFSVCCALILALIMAGLSLRPDHDNQR